MNKLEAASRASIAALNEARASATAAAAQASAREAKLAELHAAELQTARDALLVLRFDCVQTTEAASAALVNAEQRATLADELRANADARADALHSELDAALTALDAARLESTADADALHAALERHVVELEAARSEGARELARGVALQRDAEQRCADVERVVAQHAAALAEAHAARQRALELAAAADAARATQVERLAFLEAERDSHLTTHRQIVEPLNEQIVAQRMALEDAEQRIVDANAQVAQLTSACVEARQAREALRERAEAELRRLRQRDSAAAAALAHVDAQLSMRSSELDDARDELAQQCELTRLADEKAAKAQAEYALLAREHEDLAINLDTLLADLDKHGDPVHAERVRQYADAMSLQRQVTRLTGQCDAAQTTINQVKKGFEQSFS